MQHLNYRQANYDNIIQRIKEDIQTVRKERFKLQVGPLEDALNLAHLLDLVTSLNFIIKMASTNVGRIQPRK